MSSEEKLLYMISNCCMSEQDLIALLDWIAHDNIDSVYHRLHYMFDEDDYILPR